MGRFRTKEDLFSYILRQLGDGVINQEVTDQHVWDAIDDAIDLYIEKSCIGSYENRTMLLYPSQFQDNVIQLPEEVQTVTNILTPVRNEGFLQQSFMQESMYYHFGNFNGMRFDMTTSYLFAQTMDTLKILTEKKYMWNFNQFTKTLHLTPKPTDNIICIQYLGGIYRYSESLLQNSFVKRLATEYVRKVWGTAMGKYNGKAVVGGVEVDGAGMFQYADSEIKAIILEMNTDAQEPIDMLIV